MTIQDFLLGAATAAHQVEGNNINSDVWTMEQMENTKFVEPSLDALDHYNRYEEDLTYLKKVGLNAYRFSIEWARIEPIHGFFDMESLEHYQKKLEFCLNSGIEPIVTMHHFSTPKWVIEKGGWENPEIVEWFTSYCTVVVGHLGHLMKYVCTINEANMGLQLQSMMKNMSKSIKKDLDVQVGINTENSTDDKMAKTKKEYLEIFGTEEPNFFLSPRTDNGDKIIMDAHIHAREVIKKVDSDLKVGITLSLHDLQAINGGEEIVKKEWEKEFLHYVPYIKDDDFFGIQNYTRKVFDKNGRVELLDSAERTQMGYENYPQALGNVIKKVHTSLSIPIIVTENGIATSDDKARIQFIDQALLGVEECIKEGIPVQGYLHWSLLDNFEWQLGFTRTFGLIEVDRETQARKPKNSLRYLGKQKSRFV
ncbi:MULTISPECIES: glycoside hydrolase family 1 protein [unclassified Enterococcus]|uniref:glycoside hydrolase family 1 protein n=1 Tax=unclassified Enterococcus TaxID=2608891 RepID=UPI000A34DF8F|nr:MULTISPECIES: family 1 glycosylhydrolase [unclassified Enterococcus]OTO77385.1 hypothetical protein A5865_001261 [Enterococcus sp. 12E11_DIV0728]OUZ16442.1 hypothetical protein A5868_001363 [Enterococcus sp. 12F9_DIV0723]